MDTKSHSIFKTSQRLFPVLVWEEIGPGQPSYQNSILPGGVGTFQVPPMDEELQATVPNPEQLQSR